jgi:hypothetical protein
LRLVAVAWIIHHLQAFISLPLLDEADNSDLAVEHLNASFEDSSAQGAGYFFG